MADNVSNIDNSEVEPAPTECVMIKEEPDIDLEYDPCERNTIDNIEEEEEEEEDQEMQLKLNAARPPIFHGTYLPELNKDPLKRKADDDFQSSFPVVGRIYSLPVSPPDHPTQPPKKKPARTNQKANQPKTNQKKTEDDEENALRIKYLMNASDTEERMRSLQMELNKARLEREKMELESLREMHHLRLENMKLEKELLTMKLKNVTEHGVGVI